MLSSDDRRAVELIDDRRPSVACEAVDKTDDRRPPACVGDSGRECAPTVAGRDRRPVLSSDDRRPVELIDDRRPSVACEAVDKTDDRRTSSFEADDKTDDRRPSVARETVDKTEWTDPRRPSTGIFCISSKREFR